MATGRASVSLSGTLHPSSSRGASLQGKLKPVSGGGEEARGRMTLKAASSPRLQVHRGGGA